MVAAEMTSKTFWEAPQLFGTKFVHIVATGAASNDYITVTPLTIVQGVVSNYATDGTAGTHTITGTTNVVTHTNCSTKTWHLLVCGD